ncbi:MAG: hypothetical protein K2G45_01425 [Lachnospiraceae bacterium]|nr:hypothetical protein [Lachnospiraceae bacterium]
MKVLNTRRIAEKLMQIMQIRRASSMVNMIVTNVINGNCIIPSDVEALRQEALKLQKEMQREGSFFSVDQIMLLLMVESMIGPYLAEQPDIMDFFMNWIAAESKVFDVKEFNENPYIKNIDFKGKQQGDFELRYYDLMPYEVNMYNIPKRIDQLHIDIPRVSCFVEKFEYPVIFQKSIKSTWMSVSPNEVFTMEREIKNARGKVLTLGCGMGYFAYMASLKEEVESVTIIELEQSVIDLFETCILPQFQHKEKINITKADAIEYIRNIEDGLYDYCFADIWLGIADIQPYFAVKEIGRKWHKTKIDYWIEESFAILLSSSVWIEILKSFSETNNIEIPSVDC